MMNRNVLNKTKKGTKVLVASALMAAMMAQPVMAASTISSVSVKLNIDLQDGDGLPDLEWGDDESSNEDALEVVIPANKRYEIANVEWSKDDIDEAELGKTYKLKVTLESTDEDEYVFKSSYTSSKVTVKGGSFVSARRNDADQLVITLKTDEVEGVLAEPEDPRWLSENFKNDKFGYAKWDSVSDAVYQIQLYRNDKIIHKVSDWKSTSYDFYPYMTKEGDYSFRVRSVPKNDDVKEYAKGSEWNYSDELYVDEDEVSDGTGQGQAVDTEAPAGSAPTGITQVGWILNNGKWYFRYPDGSYLRNSWGKIDEKWYLFDNAGVMLTGWQKVNNVYYYLKPSGDMLTGWLLDNNIWYYLNPNGDMATGWLTVNGLTYYLDASGAMVTGWREVAGQYYYFYPDGHKAVNEFISGFYVDHNGVWKRP